MKMATDKKIIEKTAIVVIIFAFLISPSHLLRAEDYPAEYLGPGHREYLSGRIQEGYYVEEFTKNDRMQKERVDKRNQVEEILISSYQATPQSTHGISQVTLLEKYNSDKLKAEIALQHYQRERAAIANSEFTYIPYSDGKKIYFKDGLPSRIENERVLDEFGNVSIKNTYNMQYNDKRLLISYEATLKDNLGNVSQLFWYGAKYTADSLFYGGKDTVANKNLTEYWLKEIDPAGNERLTHWKGSSYEGKLLRAFSQTIDDSIYGHSSFTRSNITYAGNDPEKPSSYHEEGVGSDGLEYSKDLSGITYNDKYLTTGYHEEIITTQVDGSKTRTFVDAQFKYLAVAHQFGPDVEEPEPDRIRESIITTNFQNPDGSERTETITTNFDYNADLQLIGASGNSVFIGQEPDWFEYTDAQGHLLTRNTDADGNIIYSYVDAQTLEVVSVAQEEVSVTLKEGDRYTGTAQIQYEILYGESLVKQTNTRTSYYGHNISETELIRTENSTVVNENSLVNNLRRLLGNQEHVEVIYPLLDAERLHSEIRDISTAYLYDEKTNLIDVQASGQKSGYEYDSERGWWGRHTSSIVIEYNVILGKPVRTKYREEKDYDIGGTE